MKLGRYNSGPSWYTSALHRLAVFWVLVFSFPLIIYVLNKIAVYILGFAAVVLVYWGIWTLVNRRK